jgi:hypothetical protein
MCLTVTRKAVLKKGITVYKMQEFKARDSLHPCKYGSPYWRFYPQYDKFITDDKKPVTKFNHVEKNMVITRGYFHFFTTVQSAKELARTASKYDRDVRVIECKLRKGSNVIYGNKNDIVCRVAKFTEKVIAVYKNGKFVTEKEENDVPKS